MKSHQVVNHYHFWPEGLVPGVVVVTILLVFVDALSGSPVFEAIAARIAQ